MSALLCSGRPLRGVLFWRWDLQVYAGTDPADYGVQVQDTTFDIIKENADQLKVLSAQQPPNVSCKVGCWVPEVHAGTFSTVNRYAQFQSISPLHSTKPWTLGSPTCPFQLSTILEKAAAVFQTAILAH